MITRWLARRRIFPTTRGWIVLWLTGLVGFVGLLNLLVWALSHAFGLPTMGTDVQMAD